MPSGTPSLLAALELFMAIFHDSVKDAVAEVLKEQKAQELPVYPEKVGIAQASEITGYSQNSLYQMHSKGTIPGAKKVGGKLIFDTATLRRWVENGGNAA